MDEIKKRNETNRTMTGYGKGLSALGLISLTLTEEYAPSSSMTSSLSTISLSSILSSGQVNSRSQPSKMATVFIDQIHLRLSKSFIVSSEFEPSIIIFSKSLSFISSPSITSIPLISNDISGNLLDIEKLNSSVDDNPPDPLFPI